MTPRMRRAVLLACGGLWSAAAVAQTVRLDDSASPRSIVDSVQVMTEHGRPLQLDAAGPPPRYAVVRFGRVEYRLATAPYVGRAARIYFVVPGHVRGLVSPAGLKMEWRGSGLFADGWARAGERRLVWSGTVRDATMREALDLTMEVRLADLNLRPGAAFSLESYFEIEVLP